MDKVSFMPVDHAAETPAGPVSDVVRELCESFGKTSGVLTTSGRAGIEALLKHLQLGRADEVFISTTYDYPNVSSCVTCTVFNAAKPSRVLTDNTRLILIIHEFGIPHEGTPQLKAEAQRRGIPLLEDCAHTISSRSAAGWRVGEIGDWTLVSFPKIFPIDAGGALLGPTVDYGPSVGDLAALAQLSDVAGRWWKCHESLDHRRREVFGDLTSRFAAIGLAPLFSLNERIAPWFFPVPAGSKSQDLIDGARNVRIDCTRWHGTDIVIYPCHPFLRDEHLERIASSAAEALAN